jgi:hypothetical protein
MLTKYKPILPLTGTTKASLTQVRTFLMPRDTGMAPRGWLAFLLHCCAVQPAYKFTDVSEVTAP